MISKKLIGLGIVMALFSGSLYSLTPYVGVEAQFRPLSMRGDNTGLFAKSAPAYNLYCGIELSDNFDFEVGGHFTRAKKANAITHIRGIHASIIGKVSMNASETLHGIAGVGASHLRYAVTHPSMKLEALRIVPRALLGLEIELVPDVKWRTVGFFENAQAVTRTKMVKNHYGLGTGLRLVF